MAHRLNSAEVRDPVLRLGRGLFYLGLFFTSMLVLRVGSLTIGDALLMASIICVGLARGVNHTVAWPRAYFPLWGTAVLFTMFVTGALLSAGNAAQPGESLTVVARLILVMLVLPWLARTVLPTSEQLTTAAGWLVAGAAVCASGTILQFLFGASLIPGAAVTEAGRFSGFTGHVSDLGGVASMGIAIGIGFLLGARRASTRAWSVVALGVLTVGLVLSGSVSGMAAAMVGVLVYVFRRALKFRHLILISLLLVAVMYAVSMLQSAVSALSPIERLMQTLGLRDQGRYSTSESRIETFQAAWEQIVISPLVGQGFDGISAIADGIHPPHNIIIGALFQGGILVTFVIVMMTLRPFRGRWLRQDRSPLATQLMAGAVAAIVFTMTAPSLYNRYFWIPLALLGVARVITCTRRETMPASRRLPRLSMTTVPRS